MLAKYGRSSMHVGSEQLSGPVFILLSAFVLLVLGGVGFDGTGGRHGGGRIGVQGERVGRLMRRRFGCAGRGSSRVVRGCECECRGRGC